MVPTERLPFPPLGDRAVGVEVASFDLDGVIQSFVVQESNGYWCTWIVSGPAGESGGCGATIDTSAALTIEAGYSMVAEGADTAEVVSAGTVSAESARVEVEFGDGIVVEVIPTDFSGRFDHKFWIAGSSVAVDGRSVTVRSYAANGELLGTQSG